MAPCVSVCVQHDFATIQTLRKYERWRKGENALMILAMDGFKKIFTSNIKPLVWLRNLAINMTNQINPLKYFFVKRAMGLIGDLPESAKVNREQS